MYPVIQKRHPAKKIATLRPFLTVFHISSIFPLC
jgi:multidrug efflux system membrane fusion protein